MPGCVHSGLPEVICPLDQDWGSFPGQGKMVRGDVAKLLGGPKLSSATPSAGPALLSRYGLLATISAVDE